MSVSACLITRNEAANLPDCLASLDGQVTEIVIVDTGSDDNTVAIAEAAGARVLHRPWDNDFSAPRNLGLDAAQGDWILYIDADERLRCGGASLRDRLPGSEASAAWLRLYPRLDMTAYAELRLFRNDPRIRFKGIMHERMVPGIERACEEDGTGIADRLEFELVHIGYEGDQDHKHARNLPLLERAIPLDPTRVYLRFHQGITLQALGRLDEAREALQAGIDLASASNHSQEQVEGSMCCQGLAAVLLEQGDAAASLAAADAGLRFFDRQLALEWARARALVALRREHEAVAVLKPLLTHDPETFFEPRLAYEKSLFREDSLALMGSAFFKLGDHAEAARLFDAAAAAAPENLEYRTKAAMAYARAGS